MQYLAEEKVSSDSETVMVFSGAQNIKFEDVKDTEVIWDSGPEITLAKKDFSGDVKRCKVTM